MKTNISPWYPTGKLVVWESGGDPYVLLGARPIFKGYVSFREGIPPGKGSMTIATPMKKHHGPEKKDPTFGSFLPSTLTKVYIPSLRKKLT